MGHPAVTWGHVVVIMACWTLTGRLLLLLMLGSAYAQVATVATSAPCLCVFDIDRTLTGKQDDLADCPTNQLHAGVEDCGYPTKGVVKNLTLSALAQGLKHTFCSRCFIGVVSAGTGCGSGSQERSLLLQSLNASGGLLSGDWSAPGETTSPLVTSYEDGKKQVAVAAVHNWYQEHVSGLRIADEDVHMFDDRVSNIAPFNGTGFSAHQISCKTRDPIMSGQIGLCGAELSEIVPTIGVHLC